MLPSQKQFKMSIRTYFQGVETASQIRYVTYYERLKKMKLQYPNDVSVAIKAIQITGYNFNGSFIKCDTLGQSRTVIPY